jgi:hypothetical protein
MQGNRLWEMEKYGDKLPMLKVVLSMGWKELFFMF